ncbi:MAG: DUF523 domain-containing protein [Desulfosarcinaceae bacterium]|nr:DUF523 domain-containing protein [Desulfosarcinaceae bacterium]
MAAESEGIPTANLAGKILISACLVGQPVRYNGGHQRLDDPQIRIWESAGRLIPCCPEVMGGLPTPRPPAEICGGDGDAVWRGTASVRSADGQHLTKAFTDGAAAALALARRHAIRVAIFCQRSPSCGSRRIYNGRFESVLIPGVGVTTALLRANGIAVFGPEAIATAAWTTTKASDPH